MATTSESSDFVAGNVTHDPLRMIGHRFGLDHTGTRVSELSPCSQGTRCPAAVNREPPRAIAVLRYGRNAQIRRLAQEIIVTQQQEIAAMRLALGEPLPPSVPSFAEAGARCSNGAMTILSVCKADIRRISADIGGAKRFDVNEFGTAPVR